MTTYGIRSPALLAASRSRFAGVWPAHSARRNNGDRSDRSAGRQRSHGQFFASLSNVSRHRRFFSFTRPTEKTIEFFCDSSNPRSQLSIIVTRRLEQGPSIIATGTYAARDEKIGRAHV